MVNNQKLFSDVFGRFLAQADCSIGRAARLSGLSRRTLENWLAGRVSKPRQWQDILRVSIALQLSRGDTDQFLRSAGHLTLMELPRQGNELLLDFWHVPAPSLKPPRPVHFTGREMLLAKLQNKLQLGQAITLFAAGGMGKTSIAAELAWRVAETNQFPDGLFFYSFYNQPEVELALAEIARAFGETPDKTNPALAAQRALANRQALLVLDGTEVTNDLPAILRVTGSCAVLITTRRRQDAPGHRIELAPLPLEDAVSLLQKWGEHRVLSAKSASAICDLVGCLPLAIRLVGRYLIENEVDAEEYLYWLQTSQLDALDFGSRQHESVPILLKKTIGRLSPETRNILALLGLLARQDFGRKWLAAACECNDALVAHHLGTLISCGLVVRPAHRYQVVHALIHAFANQRMAPPKVAIRHLVSAIVNEISPRRYSDLHPEMPHWLSLLDNLCQMEQWVLARDLTIAICPFLAGELHRSAHRHVIAIGIDVCSRLNDIEHLADFYYHASMDSLQLGNNHEAIAHMRQAMKIGSTRSVEYAAQLADIYAGMGDYEQAEELISTITEDPTPICHALMGRLKWRDGQHFEAEALLQTAYEKSNKQDRDTHRIAYWLGRLTHMMGHYDEGMQFVRQAIDLVNQQGQRGPHLDYLVYAGFHEFMRGNWQKAIEIFESQLEAARAYRLAQHEADVLSGIGHIQLEIGAADQAADLYRQAYAIYQSHHNHLEMRRELMHLLSAYVYARRFSLAETIVPKLYSELDNDKSRVLETSVYLVVGFLYRCTDRLEQAQIEYERARMLAVHEKRFWVEAVCERDLGCIALKRKEYDGALEHFFKSTALMERAKVRPWIAMNYAYRAIAFQEIGDMVSAETSWQSATTMATFPQLKLMMVNRLSIFGHALRYMKQLTRAQLVFDRVASLQQI